MAMLAQVLNLETKKQLYGIIKTTLMGMLQI